jgi:hypothetical protein
MSKSSEPGRPGAIATHSPSQEPLLSIWYPTKKHTEQNTPYALIKRVVFRVAVITDITVQSFSI